MALGWCLTCQKLTPIKPGEYKFGTRQRAWYPYPHETPDGKPCPGEKRGI